MAFINNKTLYVLDDNNNSIPMCDVNDEIFLTADLITTDFFNLGNSLYYQAVLSPVSYRVVRIYILNEDETVREDISRFVLSDWQFSFNCEKGSTRSGNISLFNQDNRWFPSPVNGSVWKGTKFKVYIGLLYSDVVFWKNCGIFVCSSPSVNLQNQTVQIPLHDKFALLDGTIGGKRANQFKIPVGTSVRNAIKLCLEEEKSNGQTYDTKSLIFPISCSDVQTPYTITQSENSTIGDIITELSDMVICDVFCNINGNLTLTEGAVTNEDIANNDILWTYEEGQYTYPTLNINFDKLINEVVVAGAIANGKQYKARITNASPKSQMNIYMTEPNPLYIEDSNIIGDTLCESRAKYEMVKNGRMAVSLNFESIFLPHLECGHLIMFNNSDLKFMNEKFIINSISISSDKDMSIDISSVDEVIFR